MNHSEVQCEATGAYLCTVFSYEACSTGTHTFTINWLDKDVIFSQELEAGQIFEQTCIYDVDLPGYELKLEGSNATLTSIQAWSWEIDESGCTPSYQTRGNCLAEPTFVCDGLGQVSSFSYQACSSGEDVPMGYRRGKFCRTKNLVKRQSVHCRAYVHFCRPQTPSL